MVPVKNLSSQPLFAYVANHEAKFLIGDNPIPESSIHFSTSCDKKGLPLNEKDLSAWVKNHSFQVIDGKSLHIYPHPSMQQDKVDVILEGSSGKNIDASIDSHKAIFPQLKEAIEKEGISMYQNKKELVINIEQDGIYREIKGSLFHQFDGLQQLSNQLFDLKREIDTLHKKWQQQDQAFSQEELKSEMEACFYDMKWLQAMGHNPLHSNKLDKGVGIVEDGLSFSNAMLKQLKKVKDLITHSKKTLFNYRKCLPYHPYIVFKHFIEEVEILLSQQQNNTIQHLWEIVNGGDVKQYLQLHMDPLFAKVLECNRHLKKAIVEKERLSFWISQGGMNKKIVALKGLCGEVREVEIDIDQPLFSQVQEVLLQEEQWDKNDGRELALVIDQDGSCKRFSAKMWNEWCHLQELINQCEHLQEDHILSMSTIDELSKLGDMLHVKNKQLKKGIKKGGNRQDGAVNNWKKDMLDRLDQIKQEEEKLFCNDKEFREIVIDTGAIIHCTVEDLAHTEKKIPVDTHLQKDPH